MTHRPVSHKTEMNADCPFRIFDHHFGYLIGIRSSAWRRRRFDNDEELTKYSSGICPMNIPLILMYAMYPTKEHIIDITATATAQPQAPVQRWRE